MAQRHEEQARRSRDELRQFVGDSVADEIVKVRCRARQDLGRKGQTPVVERPGQRQSIGAASAVNARGAFWSCTYEGGLNAELFVSLLRKMMRHRSKPVHLVIDGLPAHKTALVRAYVASTDGMLIS